MYMYMHLVVSQWLYWGFALFLTVMLLQAELLLLNFQSAKSYLKRAVRLLTEHSQLEESAAEQKKLNTGTCTCMAILVAQRRQCLQGHTVPDNSLLHWPLLAAQYVRWCTTLWRWRGWGWRGRRRRWRCVKSWEISPAQSRLSLLPSNFTNSRFVLLLVYVHIYYYTY